MDATSQMEMQTDQDAMRQALLQASLAMDAGEVPVGAVVVRSGKVIATGYNRSRMDQDPTAHAEIVALRAAAKLLGNYRLEDCSLYVTLEPCAMCAGALLHARLARVVYGASDPKTGAAGSVVNLFSQNNLNHQTQVRAGVLADECSQIIQTFFQSRREASKLENSANHPLREDALRAPDRCFSHVPGYPWSPNYVSDLPALAGLRLHYLDVASEASENPSPTEDVTWLCLHGNPAWSYLYRKMIPTLQRRGRVVAPDLIGFGKSDKLKKETAHSFSWHRQVLLELVERLDLRRVVLVVQDWGGLLGLTLPMATPKRYCGLVLMNTFLATGIEPLSPGFMAWRTMCAQKPEFDIAKLFARGNPQMTALECSAYMAPFPDKGHRAATRAFPSMVPSKVHEDGASWAQQALHFFRNDWQGKSQMFVGMQDPVLGAPVMQALHKNIRNCPEPVYMPNAGHFVQEHGEVVAQKIAQHFFA